MSMSASIRLIRDLGELRGTCYFEFLPGRFRGQHWNPESVFVSEDGMYLIEHRIGRHCSSYSRHAFGESGKTEWIAVIAELRELAQRATADESGESLQHDLDRIPDFVREDFVSDLAVNSLALASLANDLANWAEAQLKSHNVISILGL